jgi:hypothetical protein
VRHRHRAGEARGQAQFEVTQTFAAQRSAKTNHGGLAHLGGARDVGHRVVEYRARVGEHMIGHPPLGGRQAVFAALDLAQDGRGLRAFELAKLRREDGRHAEEGGVVGSDHPGGDLRQVVGEAAFVFETLAKVRTVEPFAQARHDAPADVDAPQCAQGHREVGRGSAEHGAKHIECFGALFVVAFQCATRDLGRGQIAAVAGAVAQGLVDQLQAGA